MKLNNKKIIKPLLQTNPPNYLQNKIIKYYKLNIK